jgi:hypothetical protein
MVAWATREGRLFKGDGMIRLVTAALAMLAISAMCPTATARRGGGTWLDSPGYQRALQESRRARSQQQLDQLELERRALHKKNKKKKPAT